MSKASVNNKLWDQIQFWLSPVYNKHTNVIAQISVKHAHYIWAFMVPGLKAEETM